MSNDPYPDERPDPRGDDPYSTDPYVRGGIAPRPQLPAYEPGRSAPLPAPGPPGAPMQPGAPVPPPYHYAPGARSAPNTSAIVLTVVSGVATLTGLCCYLSIIPLVFGILGIVKQDADPDGAAQMTKYGWISFAAIAVVALIGIGAFVALIIASES